MSDPASEEIEAAISGKLFKLSARTLETLEPSLDAVWIIENSYSTRQLEPFVIACLLNANGHAAGYDLALRTLVSAEDYSRGVYSSVACAKLDKQRAASDLPDLLSQGPDGAVMRAAAAGLVELKTGDFLQAVIGACVQGNIRPRDAGKALTYQTVDLLWLLQSDDKRLVRAGLEVIYSRIQGGIEIDHPEKCLRATNEAMLAVYTAPETRRVISKWSRAVNLDTTT